MFIELRDGKTLDGKWQLVPVEPTGHMVVHGFESWPDEHFSSYDVWEKYEKMTGCQQAAHRARLCYAAMLAEAVHPLWMGDSVTDVECEICDGTGTAFGKRCTCKGGK